MAESLEDFLKPKSGSRFVEASGHMKCVECEESVYSGKIDEDNMLLIYHCTRGHESRIKI